MENMSENPVLQVIGILMIFSAAIFFVWIVEQIIVLIAEKIFKKKINWDFGAIYLITMLLTVCVLAFLWVKDSIKHYNYEKDFLPYIEEYVSSGLKKERTDETYIRGKGVIIEIREKRKFWLIGEKIEKKQISDINIDFHEEG